MGINYLEKTTEEKISAEIKPKIEHLATKEDMQKLHTSIIKWMFIFWIGAVGSIIAVMKLS